MKKDLGRLIKKKVWIKYVTLVLAYLSFIPDAGMLIAMIFAPQKFGILAGVSIGILLCALLLAILYEKYLVIPSIDSSENLYAYLQYFTIEHKYLEHAEAVTWFYRLIRDKHRSNY